MSSLAESTTGVGASSDSWETWVKGYAYSFASYLTDPVCNAHEATRMWSLTDVLHADSFRVTNYARKFFLGVKGVFYGLLAIPTAPAGIFLRYLAGRLQTDSYIYYRGEAEEKTIQNEMTLLSWNVCCTSAGYAISDGGVLPWRYRLEEIAQKIKEKDADVVCLYELFDANAAFALFEKLKGNYSHFYFNIGPRPTGVSSGIFVASKLPLNKPEFIAFPKDMLVGRTKNAEKGVFSFEVQDVAHIFATHLQHSEESAYPTDEEIKARREEMELIAQKMDAIKGKAVILTGDLNFGEVEHSQSNWVNKFDRGTYPQTPSWGGDEFCATKIAGRPRFSKEMNLDYTMFVNGTAKAIDTQFIETGFQGSSFNSKALSDHKGLYSKINFT
ncbi:MAG: endonuclease/exonuclease/phosphatase family protein [Verrucomicrobia bacterium]|nr:endonuclease/exonuclease/phosphatase family protein [Verrucomicrobiota bacterium]